MSQSELLTPTKDKDAQPAHASDYTQYYCPLCDQRVLSFDRENHTREKHAGVDPG